MLFEQLSKIKRNAVMTVIVLVTIGILLLAIPVENTTVFETVAGFALLILCCVRIFEFIGGKGYLIDYIRLGIALLAGVVGLLILLSHEFFITLLSLISSLLPIVMGIYGIFHAYIFVRRSGRKGWMILAALSFVMIIFGLFLLTNPFSFDYAGRMKVNGGILIYSSILEALSLIWILPAGRKDKDNG